MDLERIVLDYMLAVFRRSGNRSCDDSRRYRGLERSGAMHVIYGGDWKPSSVRQVECTYLPWTLELDDLDAILVNDDLGVALSRVLPVLNHDEEYRAHRDRDWIPLGRRLRPCLDELA